MPQMMNFGQGIVLLMGLLICAGAGLLLLVILYMVTRITVFQIRQRRSYREYHCRTRRADGKMYPPVHPDFCEQCGRGSRAIHFLATGEKLCRECYEVFWRRVERYSDEPPPREPAGMRLVQKLVTAVQTIRRPREDQ